MKSARGDRPSDSSEAFSCIDSLWSSPTQQTKDMTTSSEIRGSDLVLLIGAIEGHMEMVREAFSAGANVNGNALLPCPPIVAATYFGYSQVVNYLLVDHQADPDIPVPGDWHEQLTVTAELRLRHGQRAFHFAANNGCVETISMLLQAGADPNTTDARGQTPLLVACAHPDDRVEIAQLLLEADADPAHVDEHGHSALHLAALYGCSRLIDLLHSKTPDSLNRYNIWSETPLSLACSHGHESTVLRLLSSGAKQRTPYNEHCVCPLAMAVRGGHISVVRIIIKKGMEAVGGKKMLPYFMYDAIQFGRAWALDLFLKAHGEAKRAELPLALMLHDAARHGSRAVVDVLLRVGADEATPALCGRFARDVIGVAVGRKRHSMDREEGVAIGRMLRQGAAYRARSWLWPAEDASEGGGDNGDGNGGGLSFGPAQTDLLGVSLLRPARTSLLGVRIFIFRPEGRKPSIGSSLIDRYSEKA